MNASEITKKARKAEDKLLDHIMYRNMRGIRRALAAGAPLNGFRGSLNWLPLLHAARGGSPGVINLLLEKGAILEIASTCDLLTSDGLRLLYKRGTHALHVAAQEGEVDALRTLLQAGAHPNVRDDYGRTPLMAACDGHQPAAQRFDLIIEMLLEAGALPSVADDQGCVPLHAAACFGADDAIEVLVAVEPATLALANNDGLTPLSVAAGRGHESAVRLLLALGASDKEACAENRESSLELAAKIGHEGVTAVLLGAGLEAVGGVEAVRVAMASAITNNKPRVLDMLLGVQGEEMRGRWAGADSPKGSTMLVVAASVCGLAVTRVLLAAGAGEGVLEDQRNRLLLSEILARTNSVGALGRTLEREKAFRARSYCWPVETSSVPGLASVLEAPCDGEATTSIWAGVRIFRSSPRIPFTSRIAR